MFTQRVGSPTATLVFESPDDPKWIDDWSADGKFLLFHLPRPSKLFAVPMEEPRTAKLLIDTSETIDSAHFSPDGKWIAYEITEAGVYQVWVASFRHSTSGAEFRPRAAASRSGHRSCKATSSSPRSARNSD